MNADLTLALNATIAATKTPFKLFNVEDFSGGEGKLEGDWTVIAESDDNEYAVVIETVKVMRPTPTIAGMRDMEAIEYRVFYPFFDEGDPSVGLEDAWIIDFDYDHPDYVTDGLADVAMHAIFYFLQNDIIERINSDFEVRDLAREEQDQEYIL